MSDIKFDKTCTPEYLVKRAMALNVPVYQRLFVWKAAQIQNLFSNLYDSCRQSNGLYHIGVISVWNNAKKNNIWDVVDGQQRLTFLSLFAAWSVANLQAASDESGREMWRTFLFADEKLRLSFTGRPDDEKAIKDFANGKMPQTGAFRCFAETTDAFFSNHKQIDRNEFAQYVYKNCAFLVDVLPDGYGPYELNLYFEKMNSTGRQLEPIDMVKGIYFSSDKFAKRWNEVFRTDGGCSQDNISIADIIDKSANATVDKETSVTGNTNDSTAETKRLVSDEVMLLHSLCIVNHGNNKKDELFSLDKSHLLEMFGKYFDGKSNEEAKDTFLTALEKYSSWMDKYIIRIAKDEKQGANRYIFASTNGDEIEAYGSSHEDAKTEDAKTAVRLKQFESMLFVSSNDSQDWILEAYLSTRKSGGLKDHDLLEVLKKIDAEKHPLPNGENGENSWLYGQIDRYWFWKLDYLLWERHEDEPSNPLFKELRKEPYNDHDAISNYVFRKDRSIEHLHPQNPSLGQEDDDWVNDRKENDKVRNGFGNLAMISSSFNSAQGNDSISTKMGRIDDQVMEKRLQSIKLLLMVRSVKLNGWSVTAAQTHGREMLEFLDVRVKQ